MPLQQTPPTSSCTSPTKSPRKATDQQLPPPAEEPVKSADGATATAESGSSSEDQPWSFRQTAYNPWGDRFA
ncbi:hypothetical protein TWF696_008694 [Orbilia brochopaga]|uniref:Uncharacterized protein n=1 Tax=Orbilia brochopaga TaxID=3140254 RepID=A0AAV9UKC6_9PEZI